MGKPIKAEEFSKAQEMKQYLTAEFGHDKIQHVDEAELKKKITGEALIDRLKYRKSVGLLSIGKKAVVQKGQKFEMASVDASKLEEKHQHEKFGFVNLHYSVSEASGSVKLQVRNKKKASGEEGKIGVRTQLVNEGAKIGKDFQEIDYEIDFQGAAVQFVEVKIFDDEQWEPDRDF